MTRSGEPWPGPRGRAPCLALAALLLIAASPDRGRAIVLARETSTCLLCHAGPFPEPHLQGDIGPSLAGVGSRLTAARLRQQLVDPRTLNPETVMPSFAATEGLTRVGRAWAGRPVLTPEQIDDVVAYLETLK